MGKKERIIPRRVLLIFFLIPATISFAAREISDEIMVRRSELIVVAKVTNICNAIKVIPFKAWYPDTTKIKKAEERRLVLGGVKLKVKEVLKGDVPPDFSLFFLFPNHGFYMGTKGPKSFKMTDFFPRKNDIQIGSTGIFCLQFDEISSSYILRKREQLKAEEEKINMKKIIKEQPERKTEKRNLTGRVKPDILEGVIKEIDPKGKHLLTITVPSIGIEKFEKLAGDWTFKVPFWFMGTNIPLSANDLVVGDKIRVISVPGEETDDIKERDMFEVKLIKTEPMSCLKKFFSSEKK